MEMLLSQNGLHQMKPKQYDPIKGIPRFSYYLVSIWCDGMREEEHPLYHCRFKKPLLKLCKERNWSIEELEETSSGWYECYLKYRIL